MTHKTLFDDLKRLRGLRIGADFVELDVDVIQIDGKLQPTDDFVESVRVHGVIVPILVRTSGEEQSYKIVDGRRRLLAARLVGLKKIKALVQLHETDLEASVKSLVTQTKRSENPIAGYEAVRELISEGYSKSEITEATGLSVKDIDKLLKLDGIGREMMEGVEAGTVALGTALKVASLTDLQRQKAVAKFKESGKLTGKQVDELRQAAYVAGLEELSSMFEEVELKEEKEWDWAEVVRGMLQPDESPNESRDEIEYYRGWNDACEKMLKIIEKRRSEKI